MGPHRHFPYFCTPLTANHIATQGISQNFDKLSKEREKASNISHVLRQLDKILWLKDFKFADIQSEETYPSNFFVRSSVHLTVRYKHWPDAERLSLLGGRVHL